MPLPEDYLVVGEALYLSKTALQTIRLTGPRSKFHDAKLIRVALPDKLLTRWRDLQRAGFEEAECRICNPPYRFDGNGKQVEVGADRLFLIYTRRKEFGDVVFDWEWKPGSTKTGALYDGHYFGEKIQ